MTRLKKYFLAAFIILFCSNLYAQDKVVILDLKYVLNQSKAGKGAQDFLKKSYNNNIKKFKDIEAKLKKEEEDLLSKKTVLSKEEYTKKSDSLRKKVIDYKSQRRAAMDKITTQRAEARSTLIKSVDPILQTYITENNISVVINKGSLPIKRNCKNYFVRQYICK